MRNQEDFEDEIRSHLNEEVERLRAQGMSAREAELAARRHFGNVGRAQDRFHEAQRFSWLHDAGKDVRYALRMLLRSPGFAITAVLTIALGIGATTAIFSVVDAVLLRPFPFRDGGRLVIPTKYRLGTTDESSSITYRDFLSWKKDSAFARVAMYQDGDLDLTGTCGTTECEPARVHFAYVTREFFDVLGVRPLIGRFPQDDEFIPNSHRPVILSYALWQRRYGGDPAAIGTPTLLGGLPATIVGVMPRGGELPRDADAWYPYRAAFTEDDLAPDNFVFQAIARLRDDRTLEQTRAQLTTLSAGIASEFSQKRKDVRISAQSMREFIVGKPIRRALWVMLGAVAFVLIIACVNVANLLLVRASARERELTLRAALGSGRWRIVRQLLTESLVLALVGGAFGLAIAVGMTRVLVSLAPPDVLLIASDVRLSLPTLAVAATATVLAAIIFGLVPAWRASSAQPARALASSGSRTAGGRGQRRIAAILVVAEVALSLTLLTGAGLLVKSLMNLRGVDTGLDINRAITFQLSLPGTRFNSRARVIGFWTEYLRRVRALPGVTAASMTTALPLGGGGFYLGRTLIEMGKPEPPGGSEVNMQWNVVDTDYFTTVGQRLIAGRDFDVRDDTATNTKMIVSRSFVERMWPEFGGDVGRALGRTLFSWRDERVPREVVGVAEDVRYYGAADSLHPLVWVPFRQTAWGSAALIVRGHLPPAELIRSARRELAALDPQIPVSKVQSMEQMFATSMAPQRFNATLLGSFAILALVLAVIGLYGVLAYGVARETREIGVRMALGASPGGVKRRVLLRSLGLAGTGAAIGLAGSVAMTRALESLLFGVTPTDPGTFVLVTALLLGVAAMAAWIPARRATRIDPASALRAE